jgi:protoporphyrinogen oxidase
MEKVHIAIVGSGIAGLAALWELRKLNGVELGVHPFEKNGYFGKVADALRHFSVQLLRS